MVAIVKTQEAHTRKLAFQGPQTTRQHKCKDDVVALQRLERKFITYTVILSCGSATLLLQCSLSYYY